MEIDIKSIQSVYSGKPGCCCGCRGKHYYASNVKTRASAGKARGYEVKDDEVSDGQVTRVVKLLEKNADKLRVYNDFVSLDTENKLYIAYFKN
jgi:hypothetical protein